MIWYLTSMWSLFKMACAIGVFFFAAGFGAYLGIYWANRFEKWMKK